MFITNNNPPGYQKHVLFYHVCLWRSCYYHLLGSKHEALCVWYFLIVYRHNHWSFWKLRYSIFIITHGTVLLCIFSWWRESGCSHGFVNFQFWRIKLLSSWVIFNQTQWVRGNIYNEIFNNISDFIKNRLRVDCIQCGFSCAVIKYSFSNNRSLILSLILWSLWISVKETNI